MDTALIELSDLFGNQYGTDQHFKIVGTAGFINKDLFKGTLFCLFDEGCVDGEFSGLGPHFSICSKFGNALTQHEG